MLCIINQFSSVGFGGNLSSVFGAAVSTRSSSSLQLSYYPVLAVCSFLRCANIWSFSLILKSFKIYSFI